MNETTTLPDLLDDAEIREADHRAVQRFAETGEPVDPAVAARVCARADRAREANFRRFGYVNIDALLRPSVDDE